MNNSISCNDLAALMSSDSLFAVFDVRERGEYNQCQIPKTTSLPRSQIEFRVPTLVPRQDIPIVVYDGGGIRASLASTSLTEVGYNAVSVLDGGLAAWQAEGRETVSGVNVPSKAFGEKVHHEQNVPDLSPEELKNLMDCNAELTILDMRTPEEYRRFCIPGGLNVPGGELILWVEDLRQKPAVIVNCAGRTRSIIGAASLRRLGLKNVRALRNGTMGWLLAGFELERAPERIEPSPSHESRARAPLLARRVASESGIELASIATLADPNKSSKDAVVYFIDVRSESEYEAGHIPGSLCLPGGQAVQRADDFVAVRNARIVFIDDEFARAVMAADWFLQMGFLNIAVLEGGLRAWTGAGGKLETGSMRSEVLGFNKAVQVVRQIDAASLKEKIEATPPVILDVGSSVEFATAHVPGARWITRGWLEVKIPELFPERRQTMVTTCRDGQQSVFAARTLHDLGYENVLVLADGVRAWSAAGFATERGSQSCLVEVNDVVSSPSIRGNREEMQRYLNWELTLKH
jgi:rhodanese-related sulfurtransferase